MAVSFLHSFTELQPQWKTHPTTQRAQVTIEFYQCLNEDYFIFNSDAKVKLPWGVELERKSYSIL